MRIKITSILAAGLLSLPLVALAADATPKMGSSKDKVRSQFGAPVKQIPGVGTPSISRWEYQDFTVYFENGRALHSVRHATALAQPPAAAPAQSPAETLPPIEEINDETDNTPAAATPIAEAPAEQPAGETESAFRFDPVTGRITEVGADGKAIQPPTAQPAPAAPKTAPLETKTPAPTAEAEPEATSEDLNKEQAAAAASGAKSAVETPVAPAPIPAAATETETETGQPQFRFDPVSGRIVVDDPAAKPKAAPSEAPKQSAPTPAQESKPEAKPKAEKKKEESGGFSVDWGA